ncbi:MAG: nitroreductase family protein [Acidimicrobiia bacterium]|nr:nitroreductase family protein [Acidimicrobiia bacterium]
MTNGEAEVPAEAARPVEQAIRRRRMIRSFAPEPLDPDLVSRLLDTARRAPSAGNCQAAGFILLDTPELIARYWDTTLPPPRRDGFRWQQLLDAPVLAIVTTEPDRYPARYTEPDKVASGRTSPDRWPVPYWWVDAGAVAQNLLLLAVEEGLGACLFGPFDHEAALKEEFGVDPSLRLVATIALGHRLDPAAPEEPGRSAGRARRSLDELIIRPRSRSSRPPTG